MTTMIRINKIICPSPPMSKNPKVDKSHRKRRIVATIRKIPGSMLIRKRIIIRKIKLCKVNIPAPNAKRGKEKKLIWIKPKSQKTIKIIRSTRSIILILLLQVFYENTICSMMK